MAGIGGKTNGSGRKPSHEPTKQLTIQVPITLDNWLRANVKNKTAFFVGAIREAMKIKEGEK